MGSSTINCTDGKAWRVSFLRFPLLFPFVADDAVKSSIPDAIVMTQTCRLLKLKFSDRRPFRASRSLEFGIVVTTTTIITGKAARYLWSSLLIVLVWVKFDWSRKGGISLSVDRSLICWSFRCSEIGLDDIMSLSYAGKELEGSRFQHLPASLQVCEYDNTQEALKVLNTHTPLIGFWHLHFSRNDVIPFFGDKAVRVGTLK